MYFAKKEAINWFTMLMPFLADYMLQLWIKIVPYRFKQMYVQVYSWGRKTMIT